MNATCVRETYASAHIYEHEVARRWFALPAGVLLPLDNAESCQLLFAGRPGSAAGPDVQDAVLRFAQGNMRRVGDVEFHVRTSDWFTHQHHKDARYNSVLLHVVFICDTLVPTLRQDGIAIPTCSLYDLPLYHQHTSSQTCWPCHAVLPYMSDEERTCLLKQAGRLRFEQKVDAFVGQLHTSQRHASFSTYDICLIIALAEGLGYGRDRAFFRATGQYLLGLIDTVPEPLGHTFDPPFLDASRLAVLKKLVAQWRTRSAWEMMRAIILNNSRCGRPQGSPPLPTPPPPLRDTAALVRQSTCERDVTTQLRAIFSGLGTARSDILICNVILPFAMAVGLIENDHDLVERAQMLYCTYPSLPSNRITRAMSAQLQLLAEPEGACQQQGLHYIYQQTCKEKCCEECIVGRRKL